MKQVYIAIIAGCVVVLALLVGYWLDLPGVHQLVGAANDALTQVFGALFAGVKILFFTGLVLGVAYAVIELRKRNRITLIGHGKHGPAQAVLHGGQLVQLTQPGQAQLGSS